MPPPGGTQKKKKGRAPKHQNTFAFRHNPKSKKTDKILASPNVGLCQRCHDKIEWRKKYRKYKPRSQPGKCNLCSRKNVLAAYHTICGSCANSDRAVAAAEERRRQARAGDGGALNLTPTATPVEGEGEGGEEAGESPPAAPAAKPTPKRRTIRRVCAVCADEPAMSKHPDFSGEDGEDVERLHGLEDALESGVREDGRKLTLRETKGAERKIEKIREELKERKKGREAAEEGGDEDDEEAADEGEGDQEEGEEDEEDDDCDSVPDSEEEADPSPSATGGKAEEELDPFLLATRGKALVGEEYQKMLLARAGQRQ